MEYQKFHLEKYLLFLEWMPGRIVLSSQMWAKGFWQNFTDMIFVGYVNDNFF